MTAEKTEKNNSQQQDIKQALITYFKGVKAEWGKVSWPQKQQIITETGIVLAVVAFFTIAVFLMDKIFIFILYPEEFQNFIQLFFK